MGIELKIPYSSFGMSALGGDPGSVFDAGVKLCRLLGLT
jgi:hypothetical protein